MLSCKSSVATVSSNPSGCFSRTSVRCGMSPFNHDTSAIVRPSAFNWPCINESFHGLNVDSFRAKMLLKTLHCCVASKCGFSILIRLDSNAKRFNQSFRMMDDAVHSHLAVSSDSSDDVRYDGRRLLDYLEIYFIHPY